jgi:hypothetical protein
LRQTLREAGPRVVAGEERDLAQQEFAARSIDLARELGF